MIHLKNIPLAALAIAVLLFGLSNRNHPKKPPVEINNCYENVSGLYLSTCFFTPNWMTINCTNKSDALNKIVKKEIIIYSFTTDYIECNNSGNTICCIQFESAGSTDPCATSEAEQKGTGNIYDYTNAAIPSNNYVKLKAIECKDM